MIITHGESFICSGDVALGRVGPTGLVLDGQSLVDVAQFVRALNATVYNRGRGPRELSFSVWAFFTTEAAALECFLTHEDNLALQDDLEIADDGETVAYIMADAAAQVRAGQLAGLSVRLDYKFTGAKFAAA